MKIRFLNANKLVQISLSIALIALTLWVSFPISVSANSKGKQIPVNWNKPSEKKAYPDLYTYPNAKIYVSLKEQRAYIINDKKNYILWSFLRERLILLQKANSLYKANEGTHSIIPI